MMVILRKGTRLPALETASSVYPQNVQSQWDYCRDPKHRPLHWELTSPVSGYTSRLLLQLSFAVWSLFTKSIPCYKQIPWQGPVDLWIYSHHLQWWPGITKPTEINVESHGFKRPLHQGPNRRSYSKWLISSLHYLRYSKQKNKGKK